MQRKQGSPLSGSITEARGFISGKICRGNYDSAVYMETKWTHKADEKRRH